MFLKTPSLSSSSFFVVVVVVATGNGGRMHPFCDVVRNTSVLAPWMVHVALWFM